MKFIFICVTALLCTQLLYAQHRITISVILNDQPAAGASAAISGLNLTAIADSSGVVVFKNVPAGKHNITLSFIGAEEQDISVALTGRDTVFNVTLKEEEENEEAIIVSSTRLSRSIKNTPTRIETISGEELTEKGNMKPGDIRMLLNESTGIQTQQTSAISNNSSIRIQGLDGRYTQILRDGFPLYAGFSGGLSLMQVAPLDLKQIEVIKGSASTLYGGGAIAGLVNLISKTPGAKRELNFIINGTSAGGLDVSGFYSQKFTKTGITFFGSSNFGSAYDPAGIGLSATPKFSRYTFNPKLFFYGKKITANAGVSYITENRLGGSIGYIRHGDPGYFEMNKTDRITAQAEMVYAINTKSQLNFKNSYSRFNRLIEIPAYSFRALQQSTFTELTYSHSQNKMNWTGGINFLTDDLAEDKRSANILRNYHYNTFGVFLQNTWSPVEKFTLETGLRADNTKPFGTALLPRISALLKINPNLSVRAGGGLGYKTPTIFNEEAEKNQFQNILPIDDKVTKNERSDGGNFDINYKLKAGSVGIAVNQLFFYTKLKSPLVLTATGAGKYQFTNAGGHIDTKGFETNLRFTYHDFKLFFGYTYADVNTHYTGIKERYPLTARNRLNNVLVYEKEGRLKIGLEAYYYSSQILSDNSIGKSFWTYGLMGEKIWKRFSLFINLENFTDTRQTRFDKIYTGSVLHPQFRDIYAPLDGFVVNGGLKLRF